MPCAPAAAPRRGKGKREREKGRGRRNCTTEPKGSIGKFWDAEMKMRCPYHYLLRSSLPQVLPPQGNAPGFAAGNSGINGTKRYRTGQNGTERNRLHYTPASRVAPGEGQMPGAPRQACRRQDALRFPSRYEVMRRHRSPHSQRETDFSAQRGRMMHRVKSALLAGPHADRQRPTAERLLPFRTPSALRKQCPPYI